MISDDIHTVTHTRTCIMQTIETVHSYYVVIITIIITQHLFCLYMQCRSLSMYIYIRNNMYKYVQQKRVNFSLQLKIICLKEEEIGRKG